MPEILPLLLIRPADVAPLAFVCERVEYEPHHEIVAQGTDRMIRCALRAVPALAAIG